MYAPWVASALLLLALAPGLPYAYVQLLRWAVTGVAGYGAYRAMETGRTTWLWVMVSLAILFNPIAPIRLGRATWQVVDLAAAVVFLCSRPLYRSRSS
jgi:hypothetical protein